MGPVEDASAPAAGAQAQDRGPAAAQAAPGGPGAAPKRLYKISDGAMIGGVCNGLAAYFNIDVTIVRILFAILAFTYGAGLLLYILMMFILPPATTPAEKAAAQGAPPTAQEFIRRAKEGYYEGMKTFGDKRARRAWKMKFRHQMKGWKRDFHREMNENAHQWHQNWHNYWERHWHPAAGAWFAIPILTVLCVLITLLCVASVISLLATGAVFGIMFPPGIPLWLGVLLIIIGFKLVKWPLKAMRHGFYYGGGPAYVGPFAHLGGSCFWLVILFLSFWYLSRHSMRVHETVDQLRPQWHHAVDSFKQWWDRQ
jgi:phage shock protein PspC (stress-responsive transcriptional regulator)